MVGSAIIGGFLLGGAMRIDKEEVRRMEETACGDGINTAHGQAREYC